MSSERVNHPTATGAFRHIIRRVKWRHILAGIAVIGGTYPLAGIPAAAARATTITLATTGILVVKRPARRALSSAAEAPAPVDTYTGTFSLTTANLPALPITQPYDFALTGAITVGGNDYVFNDTPLPSASASQANALATDFLAFLSAPAGPFFPDFLPDTTYQYDATNDLAGHLSIIALADLATVFPDTGPFSALYTDGTYAVSTAGLELVATPGVPEPASLALLVFSVGVGVAGLGLARRKIG